MKLTIAAALLLFLISYVEAQCPPPTSDAEKQLARYLFELRSNRGGTGEGFCSTGDFFTNVANPAIDLTYPSYCVQDYSNDISDVTITYKYKQSICSDQPDYEAYLNATVKARIVKNPEAAALLQQPFNVITVNSTKMPKTFVCPSGYETYDTWEGEPDFTIAWEFAHVAENAYKYNFSLTPEGNAAGCNSWLSTTINRGCVNQATHHYFGYVTLNMECTDGSGQKSIPIFVDSYLLGPTPLEARKAAPWPEFLYGSEGYDPNFTFTQDGGGASPSPAPAPRPTGNIDAALQCLGENSIEYVSSATNAAAYNEARLVWNMVNDTTMPIAVAYPKLPEDVQAAVKCLSGNGVQAVPRSGGHSYTGFSVLNNAVTLDLKYLNTSSFSDDKTLVTVGGGHRLGPLYYKVITQNPGLVMPAGTCPPVGVGGLLTGGGIGYLTRQTGLSCDRIVSLKMVDAKGELIIASSDENQDLLWASCGGGGGNFGIITEYTLKLADIPTTNITSWEFKVVGPKYLDFMMYMQTAVAQYADPSLGIVMGPAKVDGTPGVSVEGMYPGPIENLESVLTASGLGAANLTALGYNKTEFEATSLSFLDFVVEKAYMEGIVDKPEDLINNVDNFDEARYYMYFKSLYVMPSGPFFVGKDIHEAIVNWTLAVREEGDMGIPIVEYTLLGPNSEVAKKANDATAYPYRNAIFLIQYGIEYFDAALTEAVKPRVEELQKQIESLVKQSPPTYINYIDGTVPLQTYYGDNFDKLKKIKSQYDPDNYWNNPMTIPVDGGRGTPSSSPLDMPPPPGVPASEALWWSVGVAVAISLFINALFVMN